MKEFEKIIRYRWMGDSDMYDCAEVGDIVRCKDCKWYRNRFNQHYCCLSAMDCPLPDDYCSRAERVDEATP